MTMTDEELLTRLDGLDGASRIERELVGELVRRFRAIRDRVSYLDARIDELLGE